MAIRSRFVSSLLLGTLLSGGLAGFVGGLTGCDKQTIDEAAQETKQAVESAADASKHASEASERFIKDANREAGEVLDKANEVTGGGVDEVRRYGKEAAERVEESVTRGLERSRNTIDGSIDNTPPEPVETPNPLRP